MQADDVAESHTLFRRGLVRGLGRGLGETLHHAGGRRSR
jgi:hypothetical protein